MQTDDSRVIGRSAWRHGCQWPPYNGNDRQRNDQLLRPHQTQFSLHDSFVSFDRIRLKVAVLVCIYTTRGAAPSYLVVGDFIRQQVKEFAVIVYRPFLVCHSPVAVKHRLWWFCVFFQLPPSTWNSVTQHFRLRPSLNEIDWKRISSDSRCSFPFLHLCLWNNIDTGFDNSTFAEAYILDTIR